MMGKAWRTRTRIAQDVWCSVRFAVGQAARRMVAAENDNDDLRLQKLLLLASSLIMSIAGVLWGSIYLYYK